MTIDPKAWRHALAGAFRREKLDEDLHQRLVQALFKPIGQIVFSTIMSTLVSIEAHRASGDGWYLTFAGLFATIGTLRFASQILFRLAARRGIELLSLDEWEMIAMAGAFAFASVVGTIAGYAAWTELDPRAEVLVMAAALSYATGIAGRNVARREIVMGQAILTCLPMSVGLVRHLDYDHLLLSTIAGLSCALALYLATHLARTMINGNRAEKKLRFAAVNDGLTELRNRNGFREVMSAVVREHADGGRCAMLAIDLDRFKEVNDTFGHPAGDVLLQNVAKRLKECIRPGDTAARNGGDEFHVVLTDVDLAEAEAVAERVLERLSVPHVIDGSVIASSASIGLAMMRPGDTVNSVFVRADLAQYASKKAGRGRTTTFTTEIQTEYDRRKRLEEDLPAAIAGDQIFVVYQPIVDARSGMVRSCETLVRWRHPQIGNIPPLDFVPVAEGCGRIHDLGRKVLRQACADAVTWPSDVAVAVNVSAAQFERSETFGLEVLAILGETGLAPSRLKIEITESIFITNGDRTTTILNQLRSAGVRISLDDFGTGFSSLSYVKDFHFDEVKVDRSFSSSAQTNPRSMAVIRAIRQMTDDLGISLVMEGIEDAEQLACFEREGIHLIQGYLFSRPVPLAEVREKIAAMAAAADASRAVA